MNRAHSGDELTLHRFLSEYAVKTGDFVLASGQKSKVYFDTKNVTLRGTGLSLIGKAFWALQKKVEGHVPFMACGGMALGAVPIACALSLVACEQGRELPIIAVRKEKKEHGTSASMEGADAVKPGARVLLVEDVVTTGGSALRAAEALRGAGFLVDTAFCLLDRSGGAHILSDHGIQLHALFYASDFENSEEAGVSLCAK